MIHIFDFEVKENDIENSARQILDILRPKWGNSVKFKLFTDGITNKLLGCQHPDDTDKQDVILIRVYGEKTDLIIDRDLELLNMQLMHNAGCAKPVYGKFRNGIVYGFVPGECLDEKTVREPHIASLIAQEMVKMHAVDPERLPESDMKSSLDPSPCLFTKTKKYIDLSPDEFPDKERNERLKKDIPSKEQLYKELESMKAHLEPLMSPVVFTHNDLLLKNIVHSAKEDRTYFIDFEYGAFNYEAYDIGNHFCEYAGIDTVDYNLYPDKEYQMTWLRNFLEYKYKYHGKNPADITDTDVERLYVQVNKFALMAHFFWGVWALIQARYSTIDFDYLDYAVVRLGEFYAKKEQFLALKMP